MAELGSAAPTSGGVRSIKGNISSVGTNVTYSCISGHIRSLPLAAETCFHGLLVVSTSEMSL